MCLICAGLGSFSYLFIYGAVLIINWEIKIVTRHCLERRASCFSAVKGCNPLYSHKRGS